MSRAGKESTALFGAGAVVFVLGIVASIAYGAKDGQRLFFCSSVVLTVAWTAERIRARRERSENAE
ncbi:hypothetical protein OIE62_34095 [Streptomyces scopuliridis]|uniref:Uncharacterized protein n=2 Tax=Streptomyces scopuliridis TaxID=452529 RepID=A0A2T7T9R6_9ACTN|nr:hypothetical protein [Streptomyces scopuliridis]PVE11910.1 hypothetical protein Y717_07665 [Streptomyces scopuliridis RB72]WSB32496.1 hypothetical protein OG949_06240 [Streptomyces scopuliridis]WSB96743.1 hypothetical protein OG835_06840 [Streptomyces scopuliridis]WSC09554.1 hypothetical protein OIE62_34095 [Streptomyces scopuliridis]